MHTRLLLILLVCSLCCTPGCAPAVDEPCASLDECVADLHQLAQTPAPYSSTMTPAEIALLARLLTFDGAVPRLVALLADSDDAVANIAAAGLRDAEFIDPIFLPQVIAGLDRGLGWLAPALGRMPSDAAAREAVRRLLLSDRAPHNQEAVAVVRSGRRAIPFIVEAARCKLRCSTQDHYMLGHVLGAMGAERALAAPGLIAIVQDPQAPAATVRGALRLIVALKEDARSLEADLLALRKTRPELHVGIDDALISMRSEHADAILAQRLADKPNQNTLFSIAKAGIAAQSAGPGLIALLDHPDWAVRLAAARALGYIEYAPAAEMLAGLLADPSDVRMNWVAAESLGRMRNPVAVDALHATSANHWYPPVRQAAAAALVHIRDDTAYPASLYQQHIEFLAYRDISHDMRSCDVTSIAMNPESKGQKLDSASHSEALKALSYRVVVAGYAIEATAETETASGSATAPHAPVGQRDEVVQIPSVALRSTDGWLLGSDRGEWGGELLYRGDDGATLRLLNENIHDIHILGTRTVAVTGLAHLTSNHGMLYLLACNAEDQWSATPWRSLPGAPHSSWLLESGDLLINMRSGGSIQISADGTMRMAPCAK